ncbi:hypothetical protein RJ45_20050 [Photobacterium gaetbulicola]|uniref:Uncharacterized protein n=1 Tax=Photobacterium gaetbulicola TaxID=1295392 RepID=A0A0B9FZG6_9GAMM|nr:hypothetical protein [Photobacterium gaetbulicola]KHT61943.1 hypothetical protein RJ45_20050 [Photobacterium gaetbulicola]
MQEFTVLERKESYFLCTKGSGHCRIIIDDNSQTLPLGTFMLHVEEISDRYAHHANDAVFRLLMPFEEQGNIDICTLATGRKNRFVYKRCLQLGGKWEPVLNEWVFSAAIKHEVDKLAEQINSELVYIEATFNETIKLTTEPLTLFGYPLVKSVANSGKVSLNYGMKLTAGEIVCMPLDTLQTIILADSKVRLYVPKALLALPQFHEDFLCVVEVEKKRKPRKKTPFPW